MNQSFFVFPEHEKHFDFTTFVTPPSLNQEQINYLLNFTRSGNKKYEEAMSAVCLEGDVRRQKVLNWVNGVRKEWFVTQLKKYVTLHLVYDIAFPVCLCVSFVF